jgi:ribosomal protein S27AE
MVRSTTEIALEMKRLETEMSLAFEKEKEERAKEAALEAQEKEEAQKRLEAKDKAEIAGALSHKAALEEEAEQKERQQLEDTFTYLEEVLPTRESMPHCPQCGGTLWFWGIGESPRPPEISEYRLPNLSGIPVTHLFCQSCGGSVLAEFRTSAFPLSYE